MQANSAMVANATHSGMTQTGQITETTSLIDNVATHPTPEGLMLTLMPAGLTPRLTAWIIDMAIRIGIMFAVSVVFSMFGSSNTSAGLTAIAYFLINWLYPVFFEIYKDGMTPGKKSQGIYVCHDDGTPITLQASMIRNLLRVADFLPFGFVSGALSMMFNKQSQRIGDMVAGTLVVYRQQDDIEKLYKKVYGMVAQLPNSDNTAAVGGSNYGNNISSNGNNQINNIDGVNQNFNNSNNSNRHHSQQELFYDQASPLFFYPLRLNEQQALVSFLERTPFLSKARQLEIASNLTPLVDTYQATPQAINEAVYQATVHRASIISGNAVKVAPNTVTS